MSSLKSATPSRFGPGILVAAAFIGPGTITTASLAGANYGFALCWALLFSVVATYVLQEMSARLGLVTGKGLAENIREFFRGSWFAPVAALLVVAAIGLGNAAYESGNIIGAALGLQAILGAKVSTWAILVGTAAGGLLYLGKYKLLEKVMIVLVITMSLVFLLTMLMVKPSFTEMLGGLLVPRLPDGGATLTVIALIGTTVVPYNLFLHSSTAAEKWHGSEDVTSALKGARLDAGLSIGLGGLITLAVMSTSAAAFFSSNTELVATGLAQQLEPLLGSYAKYFFALGLFAAGLSSAIAAPLAASYAVCGVLAWPTDMQNTRFRLVWLAVLSSGVLFATTGVKPLTAILFAQATNGFLLPLCAVFLLLMVNQKNILAGLSNSKASNIAGGLVVLVAAGLGAAKILSMLSSISF